MCTTIENSATCGVRSVIRFACKKQQTNLAQTCRFFTTTHAHTQPIIPKTFEWEVLQHPPNSTDLVPSDYHLFPVIKNWLGIQCFDTDAELHAIVNHWLKAQVADFYREGIEKLVPRYDKCLNLNGDYVEKIAEECTLHMHMNFGFFSLLIVYFKTSGTFWIVYINTE